MRWKSNSPVLRCFSYRLAVVFKTPVAVVRATPIAGIFSCLGHPVEYRHTHISICRSTSSNLLFIICHRYHNPTILRSSRVYSTTHSRLVSAWR
ncbi:hypothetical protein IW262DRAFT_1374704 [Armillaria fumosa]|nr:hypothetical protein IW262DRAFT_1374704 [Armillaria fumosa]